MSITDADTMCFIGKDAEELRVSPRHVVIAGFLVLVLVVCAIFGSTYFILAKELD